MLDTEKKTFVLVHGAWHGGWCYRHTAAALRETMPTDQPSGSSQMLRVGLPSTFMAASHNAVRACRKAAARGQRTDDRGRRSESGANIHR
jgi:hypothetical protein